VTYWLEQPVAADPSKIKIEQINMPPLDLGPHKIEAGR
jgi:hypothetical protein